jgi:NAD(P)-dependent dehydrogenase (short-subunit alcohol dehydrogenase family)
MSGRFENQVVLVAGGTGALGGAVAQAFLAEGAQVVVTFRSEAEFNALREAAGPNAARIDGQRVDVTDDAAAAGLVAATLQRHARLDAVVNAVGGYTGGTPLWESQAADLDRMLALNLRSGYALARAVVPAMQAAGRGAIVNVAAKSGVDHPAGAAIYAASKAAAIALLDSLAADLAGTGIRVNTVLPTIIDTPANRRAMPGADYEKWPKPEELAQAIVFLCSEAASAIHGAAIPLAGNR